MRTPTPFLLAATMAATLVACSNDASNARADNGDSTTLASTSSSGRERTMIRFVNVADDMGMASLQLDGTTIFDNVASGTASDFREVTQTRARFGTRMAGGADTTTVASEDHTLVEGNRYSVFVISENVGVRTLRIMEDDMRIDSGMARIRLVHAVSGGPEIDVRLVNSTQDLFTGMAFDSKASYKDVPSLSGALQIRAKGSSTVLLITQSVTLTPGTVTTVVIHGATKPEAFILTDTITSATARQR